MFPAIKSGSVDVVEYLLSDDIVKMIDMNAKSVFFIKFFFIKFKSKIFFYEIKKLIKFMEFLKYHINLTVYALVRKYHFKEIENLLREFYFKNRQSADLNNE